MSYAAIVADIKARMEEIPDIGVVNDYERLSTASSQFLACFAYTPAGGTKEIRGWEISRVKRMEHKRGAYYVHHTFKVTGWMRVNDAAASEKVFQALIDLVAAKFRAAGEEDPSGAVTWSFKDGDNPDNGPCQVDPIDARMFGEVLCHHAEAYIAVQERIAP